MFSVNITYDAFYAVIQDKKRRKKMKKLTSKIVVVMMVAAMAFGMVACGSKTMEDYFNTDEMQKQIEQVKSQVEGSGLSVDVKAEGNKIVYTYTYDSTEYSDELKANLEEAMQGQESTLQSTAASLKEQAKIDSITMEYVYIDCNGKEVFRKSFSA